VLTRIEIHGFKSFQEFALDVEPLLMVLGPNSAGKSNLFDALALLSRLADADLATALQGGRGSIRDQFSHTSDGIAETMSFAVELLLDDEAASYRQDDEDVSYPLLSQTRVRYQLTIGRRALLSGVEELNVVDESLRPITRADDTWIATHPEYSRFARYSGDQVFLALGPPGSPLEPGNELHDVQADRASDSVFPRVLMMRERFGTGFTPGAPDAMIRRSVPRVVRKTMLAEMAAVVGPHLAAVAEELRRWRFLHPEMAALRQPSERATSPRLAPDGANLPTALAALPAAVGARVRADLVELVPGVKSAEVVENGEELALEVTFSDGQRYAQRVLSDGTLRLLALLVMLHSAEPGTLVAYEEPENGLFPGRLRELLRRIRTLVPREGALPVQVMLNGHSPAILAGLYDLPGSLAFADLVRRKDGVRRTRIRRIDTSGQTRDPAALVGIQEVEALLDAVRPELAE
jgi:predicted ATPase